MRATWILTGVLIVGALAVRPVLSVVYSEVENVEAGSVEYWLGVPNVVKSVPVVTVCDDPRYGARGPKDGAPAQSSIRYGSGSSAAHLRTVITGHFATEGCTVTSEDTPDILTCTNGDRVEIAIIEAEPCSGITVTVAGSGG